MSDVVQSELCMLKHLLFIATISFFSAACDAADDRDAPRAVIDTLPSGVVRISGPPNGIWNDETRWQLQEAVRLGELEGDSPEVFGQVWAITVDAANRIYVLDRQAKDVRVFDAQGNHVRTFGREGQGPGEFIDPFGFAWDAEGRLWVVDVRNNRYSVYDTAGVHIREYPRLVGGFSWPWPGRIAADGLLYESSFMRDSRALVAFRPDNELTPVDTFPRAMLDHEPADAPSSAWDLRDERGIGSFVGIPFGRSAQWALDAESRMWVGHPERYAIAYRTLAGDTLRLFERELTPVPVSGEEREAAVNSLSEEFRTHPKLDLSRIPQTKPYFQRLLPDDAGNLWVLREGTDTTWLFDVFSQDGFLGSIPLSDKPSLFPPPRVTRDMIVMVTHDSLGVASVVGYRIIKGAGETPR